MPEDRARGAGPGRSAAPDFFIVGLPKCGTTALHEMLRAHPQVFMPALKEPHFLALAPGERLRAGLPGTLEEYLALFAEAGPGQLRGEASTTYMRSPLAAQHIAELNPEARIVVILREPGAFLRSLHLQLLQSGVETEPDLAAALALEPQRRAAGPTRLWQQALLYSEHMRWVEQLRRYHERLGRERVLVLIYDEFRADNAGAVREVTRFLGIDDSVQLQAAERNPTVRVRESRASELMQELAIGREGLAHAAKTLARLVPRRLRRRAFSALNRSLVEREPPPPDESTLRELHRRFAPEVAAAGEYLGRDLLSLWGYAQPHAAPAAGGSR